jgi:cobalt-zinc-cadmium efflux system protein
MWVALALNVAMLSAALIGGLLIGSLALLAEAGHLVSDVGSIAVGLAAVRLAGRAPTPVRTYGYHRTEVFGALVNGITLLVIAAVIVVQAIGRLSDPPEVAGPGVLVLGAVGLAGNALATWVLAAGSRADINLEGILRHSAADALSALGVIVAGVVLLATDWRPIDPLVSLLIAALVAAGSWRLLAEPFDVLMEGAPPGIDVREVGAAIAADPEVTEVHDLHVWTLTPGFPALSAHLMVRAGSDRDRVRRRVEAILAERFEIDHTTLQVVEADVERLITVEELRTGPGEDGGSESAVR